MIHSNHVANKSARLLYANKFTFNKLYNRKQKPTAVGQTYRQWTSNGTNVTLFSSQNVAFAVAVNNSGKNKAEYSMDLDE